MASLVQSLKTCSNKLNNLKLLIYVLFTNLIIYIYLEMEKQLKSGNFIAKLHTLLNNTLLSSIICWQNNRTMIDIIDHQKLERQILPLYFRHKKYQSFVRQLNLYGFKKVKFQNNQRFTHNLLIKGFQISAITSLKKAKIQTKYQSNSSHQSQIQQKECVKFNNVRQKSGNFRNRSQLEIRNTSNQFESMKIQAPVQQINQEYCHFTYPSFMITPEQYYSVWNVIGLVPSYSLENMVYYNSQAIE